MWACELWRLGGIVTIVMGRRDVTKSTPRCTRLREIGDISSIGSPYNPNVHVLEPPLPRTEPLEDLCVTVGAR